MRVKKKFTSGAATNYVSRTRALKKLQLSLKDFRRLCILKGIYPHEPLHKKKVNKGGTENRVYYYVKDINFLASEPLINKFREYKVFLRKLIKAKAKREEDRVKILYERRPEYQLDYIVKERYPTFTSALRDLDDALCLCSAFAVLPHTKLIPTLLISDCRRLMAEFNNCIIHSQSLTKVFISIKGIYYEAELKGERITWIVPHDRGIGHVTDVDFSIMTTFVQFYIAMLGFVNYRLYRDFGLIYPPQLATNIRNMDSEDGQEAVYCLAQPIKTCEDFENNDAMPDTEFQTNENGRSLQESIEKEQARKQLFSKCKFWLNRETPKDALTLVIRNGGGTVAWDSFSSLNYTEDDPCITHQIIDRPLVGSINMTRLYVQPQWVFDSFNARRCLPIEKYIPGNILPPHLSPFATKGETEYNPEGIELFGDIVATSDLHIAPSNKVVKRKKKEEVVEMRVEQGKIHKENQQKVLNEKGHDLKMREMMIAKRYRRVYHKIKKGVKRHANEIEKLKKKKAVLSTL